MSDVNFTDEQVAAFEKAQEPATRWDLAQVAASSSIAIKAAIGAIYASRSSADEASFNKLILELNSKSDDLWKLYQQFSGHSND